MRFAFVYGEDFAFVHIAGMPKGTYTQHFVADVDSDAQGGDVSGEYSRA